MNKLIVSNLVHRPIRSLISIVAVALEVALILLIAGLSYGIMNDSRNRTAGIGADVMVGFPGETDEEFEQSRQFIESLPFTYLHVFTYSARPGTPASEAPGQVPIRVRKERNSILRQLAAAKNLEFRRAMLVSDHVEMRMSSHRARGSDQTTVPPQW